MRKRHEHGKQRQCRCLFREVRSLSQVVRLLVARLTILSSDLVLRNDDLSGIRVIRSGNRMLEDTDRPDDLLLFDNPNLAVLALVTSRAKVARITNDHLGLDRLALARHANEFTVLVRHDLLDRLGEHVGAAVYSGQSCEGLRELAEPVHGVDVGRLAVSSHGRGVE